MEDTIISSVARFIASEKLYALIIGRDLQWNKNDAGEVPARPKPAYAWQASHNSVFHSMQFGSQIVIAYTLAQMKSSHSTHVQWT